ncbi:MAG: RNA polymerase sigma factor [Muribaculaceae bacterium]|nr:RNA polymerase sigma factor [Muribaculaceae bacterium]
MHRSEFEKFVTTIRPTLLERASAMVNDTDTAADIVQDCLLKLWTMRASLDDYNRPDALAITIVHRLALNALRARKPSYELRDEIISDSQPSPEESMISTETCNEVNRVLSLLPDAQQALITMRHVDGLTNAEIAAIVGSNEGAVRTALSRALLRVDEIFTKHQLSNK